MRKDLLEKYHPEAKEIVVGAIVALAKGILVVDDLMTESAGVYGFWQADKADWKDFSKKGKYYSFMKDYFKALELVEFLFGDKQKMVIGQKAENKQSENIENTSSAERTSNCQDQTVKREA